MKKFNINEAISSTVSDMLEIGLETSFTKKELNEMGVQIAPVSISAQEIKEIRKNQM